MHFTINTHSLLYFSLYLSIIICACNYYPFAAEVLSLGKIKLSVCLTWLLEPSGWLWTDGKGRIDGAINDNGDIGRLIKSPEAPVSRKWPV